MGQTRLQGWQGFSFEDPNQADSHPTQFLGQTVLVCRLAQSHVSAGNVLGQAELTNWGKAIAQTLRWNGSGATG